jgi:hypothetical protein
MLTEFHSRKNPQLVMGLSFGIIFGFLLHKGGVTHYNVIIGQLLLEDFTVAKIILTAVIVGKIGVHFLKSLGLVELHPKPGSIGSSVIGGLIFGVGFGLLGYCPGTIAGAVGRGSLDALFGGLIGILIGSGIFAALYPKIDRRILSRGNFPELTIPRLLKVHHWVVVIPAAVMLIIILTIIERFW